LHDFDYFHICGDDVYVMVDNLRAYLMGSKVQQALDGSIDDISASQMRMRKGINQTMLERSQQRPRPLLLGFPWKFKTQLFALGGPGYTLNRAALKLLVEEGLNETRFPINNITDSREDIFVSYILSDLGVAVMDTRDEAGSWVYGTHDPQGLSYLPWCKRNQRFVSDFLNVGGGVRAVSRQHVAFHLKLGLSQYVTAADYIYRLHALLEEGQCDFLLSK
jgi:hypothetical protein